MKELIAAIGAVAAVVLFVLRRWFSVAAERRKIKARIDEILEKQQAALDARDNDLFAALDAERLRLCEKLHNLR